jgi:hypothetical protein
MRHLAIMDQNADPTTVLDQVRRFEKTSAL